MNGYELAIHIEYQWAASTLFYGAFRTANEFMSIIVDIDTKMTDLAKVMSEGTDFEALFDRATLSAEKFGQSISQVLDSYTEFARQGFKGEELGTLADAGLVASNVGDITAQKASEYMTASLIQWKMDAKDAMGIIDSWNEISNKYATTTEKLAQGQARAGATARAMGLDFDQLNAIVGTVTASTKQSGNEIGNFVKAVLPRLVGKPAQDALGSLGVSLTDNKGNLRDIIQVYTEVAEKVKGISDTERIAVVEGLAGKYHISRMQSLLDDLGSADSMYRSMYESSVNSAGSANEENERYMESLQARINLARVEVEKLALAFGDAFLTEGMIQGIQVFGEVLGDITKFVDKFGVLPALFGATGVAMFLLSSRFKALTGSIGTTTVSLLGFKGAAQASATASTLAAGATRVFSTALKGLLASTGVGIALVALGYATEAFVGSMGRQREMQESINQENRELADSYLSNKDTVNSLVEEYGKLEEAMKKGKPDTATQEKYYSVQNELAQIMPSLVKGEDSYGNKLLGNADLIESRIRLIERQIEAEKALTDAQKTKADAEKLEESKKSAKGNKAIADAKATEFGNKAGNILTGFAYKEEIKNLEDMQKALEHFENVKRKLIDGGSDKNSPKVLEVQDTIDDLTKITDQYLTYQNKAESAELYVATKATESAEKRIEANEKISQSSRDLAKGILYDATLMAKSMKESESIATIFDGIDSKGFEKNLNDATDAISTFVNSSSDDFETQKENLEQVGQKLKETLLLNAKDSKGNALSSESAQYKNIEKSIDAYIGKLILQESQVRQVADAQGISIEQARNQNLINGDLEDGTAELNEELQKYLANLQELKSVEEQLVGVSSAQLSETNDLIFLYDTLANKVNLTAQEEGFLADAKEKLLALYPEYFQVRENGIVASENEIYMLKAETKANEQLMEVIKLAKDGKLNAEQTMTYNSAMGTKARLDNAKQELIALSKLVQAYNKFSQNAVAEAERLNRSAQGNMSEDAFIKAQKFAGFAREQSNATIDLTREINSLVSEMNGYTGSTLDSYEATQKAEKASKSANKTTKESIYVSDKYKQALEKINLEIEKQQALQAKFPDYSKQHRDSLQKEIKLQKDKTKILQQQANELERQIKSGKIAATGMVSTSSSSATSTQRLSGWTGKRTGELGDSRGGGTRKHRGVDIAQPLGTRLDANVSGKVIASGNAAKNGYDSSYGNLVVVQDDSGVKHLYAHLDKAMAKLGSTITAGMQIGTIGSTGGSTGSHLHYEATKNGQIIEPSGYIADAQRGVKSTSTSGSTSVANTQQAIDQAKSDLIGIQGDIANVQQLISQLELDAVNSRLAEFENSREKYQRVLDYENAKLETLDNTSQRYVATLERQAKFLEYKQDANKQELRYINGTIARGKLSAAGMAEMQARAEELKIEMASLNTEIQQIAYDKIASIMGRYTEAIEENTYQIERSQAIQATLVKGSDAYNNETKYQTELLNENKDQLEAKRAELQKLLSTEDLSIQQEKDYQKELNETTLAILGAEDAINQYRSSIADEAIDTIKRAYEMQRDIATKQKDEEIERLEEINEVRMQQYDDDLDRFEEVINKKLQLLDDQDNEDQYNKELSKLQDSQLALQGRISSLSLSDSLADQATRMELEQELADITEEIDEKKNGRKNELRKKGLNDQLEAFRKETEAKKKAEEDSYEYNKKRLEREKADMEYYYNELINNEAYFATLRQSIIDGNIENAKNGIEGFLAEFKRMNQTTISELSLSWTELLNLIAAATGSLGDLGSIGGSTGGTQPNKQKKSDWGAYLNNKYVAETSHPSPTTLEKLKKENAAFRSKWGFPDGSYNELKNYPMTFHEGGIVGGSSDSIVQKANKLFNTKMNETMVKAEIGELFIPKKNLIGAFLPNMQNLLKSITPPPLIAKGGTNYSLSPVINVTVQGGSKQAGQQIANETFKIMDGIMRDWGK